MPHPIRRLTRRWRARRLRALLYREDVFRAAVLANHSARCCTEHGWAVHDVQQVTATFEAAVAAAGAPARS